MFSLFKKKPEQRITIIIRDQMQSPYGIVSIPRSSVVSCTYITGTGILQVVLTSKFTDGRTESKITEIMDVAKGPDGKFIGAPNGKSAKQELYYTQHEEHHMLNIGNDDEIEKVWNWLNNDIPYSALKKMREDHLKSLNDFKEEKRKEALAKAKEAGETKEEDLKNDEILNNPKIKEALKAGSMGVAVNNTKDDPKPDSPQ